MKSMVIVGTRPEAIKMAPVALEILARGGEAVICSTGQHRDMVRPILELFGLEAQHDLELMRPDQTLTYLAGAAVEGLGETIRRERPDVVLVQGDTTTAFAGALAGFYSNTRVAHVEAGLRTGDLKSPWPEEGNRLLIGRLADMHFPPTTQAEHNLLAEGVPQERIVRSGNTVVDAALETARRLTGPRAAALEAKFAFLDPWRPMVLFTMHRRESFGAPMQRVFSWLQRFSAVHPVQVCFPVHPNPHVRNLAHELLADRPGVSLIEPLEYDELIYLLQRARFVVTDSGGLVEEAPTFRKPALVLRETTERPESIEAGSAALCGYDVDKLWRLAGELLENSPCFEAMSAPANPYGDGLASRRIVEALGVSSRQATPRLRVSGR